MSKTQYAYSVDAELYEGRFDSIEEAYEDGVLAGCDMVWIGKIVDPNPPESYVDADLILEHIACQDDYCHEAAEDFGMCSDKERDELTEYLQAVVAAWVKRNKLEPRFFLVTEQARYYRNKVGSIVPFVEMRPHA